MTFREKLLRARMGQAARLLRHTDMTVYQIAEEVGYSLPSSFYHVFRSWYGVTPEQYRAANQTKNY
jgi:two-component system response regulator YesN